MNNSKKIISIIYCFIINNLIRFICVLFIILCIFFVFFSKSHISNTADSQLILIKGITLDNWSTFIGVLALFFGAIWACQEYIKSKSISQQQKSSEIAKIFHNNLLVKCTILNTVYKNVTKLDKFIIENFDTNNDFRHFNTDELRDLSNDDDFPSNYRKIKDLIDFNYIYYRILEARITTIDEIKKKYEDKNISKFTTKTARTLFILDNSNLPFHFGELIDDVLNELEYICMNISSNAADSNFIYQSLHQVFFDTVETLYFEISLRNNGKYADKFYTNIIYVYTQWKDIYKKSLKDEKYTNEKNKKCLNPKIKTVIQ